MSQMVTTCSNCRQHLAVTPADLRVGQGFVRCGRCDKVFNALLTLTEDAPTPGEADAVAHGTISVPMLDEQEALPPLPGHEEDASAGDEVEVMQTLQTSSQFRSPELQADEARPDEVVVQDDEIARDIIRQATSQPIDILLTDEEEAPSAPAQPATAVAPVVAENGEFDADAAVGNRRLARGGWYAAALLLALVLAGQYVHHNRQTLVVVPWLEAPIEYAYGLLGQQVEPHWDLAHYEVSRLGGIELAGDSRTLLLRAAVAVKKEAPWGQPPPLVRTVLTDGYGNVLATNELAPREWLLGEAPARIDPGQRLDAQLSMPAPERVTGFQLYACLPDSRGDLHCTDDGLAP